MLRISPGIRGVDDAEIVSELLVTSVTLVFVETMLVRVAARLMVPTGGTRRWRPL